MNPHHDDVEDGKLNSAGQQAIRSIVSGLPEEPLSMAWRSSLNEQLLLVAAKQQKKRRFLWVARPLAGVSFATALAVIVLIQPFSHKAVVVPDHGLESAIMADHHQSAAASDVTSAGLNFNEVTTEANASDPEDGVWSESDVESL